MAAEQLTVRVPIELAFEVPYAEYYKNVREKVHAEFEACQPLIGPYVKTKVQSVVQGLVADGYIERMVEGAVAEIVGQIVTPKIIRDAAYAALSQATESAVASALEAQGKSTDAVDRRLPTDESVDELELSVRARTHIHAAGIRTVQQLTKLTETELLKRKGLGRKSLNEIKDVLRARGLTLGMK